MIIGIDASRANTPQRTGTEWYAYHVIAELIDIIPESNEVRVYTREPLQEDMPELPAHWKSIVLSWPPAYMWTQFRLSIEMLLRRPDVLYVPAHTIPLVHPKNTVTVVHDVGFLHQESLYNTTIQRSSRSVPRMIIRALVRLATLGRYSAAENDYHKFSLRRALVGASDVITISDFSEREILAHAPAVRSKLHRIYNGLRPLDTPVNTNSQQQADDVLNRFTLEEKNYFVTVGRIEEKKNSPMLVDAFAEMVKGGYSGSLVFIGKPGYGFEEVQRRIQVHSLEKRVICTGYLDDGTTQTIIENATAFVFPTRYEGFGMPVLEAMQLHIPVICSDIPVLHEIAGEAAVFVDPTAPSGWASACTRIAADSSLRQSLILQGSEQVKRFSWKNTASETWAIIHSYKTS